MKPSNHFTKSIFFFCLVLSFCSLKNQAQTVTGKMAGYVNDAKTGETLIGATVVLEGTEFGSSTDLDGYFLIENIPVGPYNVTATFIGFQSLTKYNLVVRSGSNPDLTFNLQEVSSELEEVVVQASPFEKLPEAHNSVQTLGFEEIATYPGGNNDIARVVQSLPGVSGSVGFRNDVIIRGGAPNENVYYLDGVEIPNINHFATQGSAGGPVGMLNVSFINDVTLSTSSFSAQYDNVLSGVLQFDQRDGNPRERKTNIRVGASETALTFEGPLIRPKGENENAKVTYIASVRRSYLQFLFRLIGLPFLPDYWDYQYKINYKIDRKNEINLIGLGSIDDFSVNPPDDATLEEQATLDQIPIIKQRTNTIGVSWKHLFEGGFFRATLSGNILENEFERFENAENEEGLLLSNDSEEDENKFRFELTNFAGDWSITSGLLGQYSRYSNETFIAAEVDGNGLVVDPALTFSTDMNFYRYGMFAQASRKFFNDRLSFSVGFRLDGNTFTEAGNDLTETFSPRFSLAYQLTPQWSVSTSAGRYFKIPPYTILGYQNEQGGFANENARYIQSDHLVAGLEYLPRFSTRFSLEGFYKRYDNYPVSVEDGISLANQGGDFEVLGNEEIESTGEGRAYGMEFAWQQKLNKNFYGIFAYTLYWSEFSGTDGVLRPARWDNRHLLTFTGGYKLKRNWEAGLRFRYLGEAPFAPVDQGATLANYPTIIRDYTDFGEERLRAFNSLDIRIDKKWNYPKWTLNFFFEVTNVLSSSQPAPPEYTLERDDDNEIVQPENLIVVPGTENSSALPTIGVVLDF